MERSILFTFIFCFLPVSPKNIFLTEQDLNMVIGRWSFEDFIFWDFIVIDLLIFNMLVKSIFTSLKIFKFHWKFLAYLRLIFYFDEI